MIKLAKITFISGLLIIILWFMGFIYFITFLPKKIEDNYTITDGVVVLTGGKGRINEGISLLTENMAQKLLITGVDSRIKLEEIKIHYINVKEADLFKDKITLGYMANNTKSNVQETVIWMKDNNLKTIRLVTSSYHMPRASLEFQKFVDKKNIIFNPVVFDQFQLSNLRQNPSIMKLAMLEYSKFIWAYIEYSVFKLSKQD